MARWNPVGPPPMECVARSEGTGWYKVGGWNGLQPLIWIEGELQMFNTNKPVEVLYDPQLWETARGL